MSRSVSPLYIQKLVSVCKNLIISKSLIPFPKPKTNSVSFVYESAKKAETQQRDLVKALELYTDAIECGQKKDSSIKDFASCLHQLGYTKLAIQFLDQVFLYYDGDQNKYIKLRDNLQLQLRPTGKHQCKFLLVEGITQELKQLSQPEIQNELFSSPKRIKGMLFLKNFNMTSYCLKQRAQNILFQFQSFSAAKKTLQSFRFDQWFGLNIYWVNSQKDIVCGAQDGRKEFQQGNIITIEMIKQKSKFINDELWVVYGEHQYKSRKNKGFWNLLASRLVKEKQWQRFLRAQRQKQRQKSDQFDQIKVEDKKRKKKKFK